MTSVAIIGGWSEGSFHSRLMRKQITRAGFIAAKDPAEADVIITHSAGCYLLPKHYQAELVVMINPPYWPGKSLSERAKKNIVLDAPKQLFTWGPMFLINRLFNFLYMIVDSGRNSKIVAMAKSQEPQASNHTLLIRNTGDVFCSPLARDKFNNYAQLPGLHEDCWYHPKPYIDLLLKSI